MSELHGLGARRRALARADDAAHALRDASGAAAGVRAPDAYPVVVTRSFTGPVTPLPRARRHAFLAHLVRVARDAFAHPHVIDAPPGVPTPDDAALLGRACATCGGHCCSHGGDRAFVSADTVRRYAAEHPAVRASHVVRAYARRLRGDTHDGSCVFHRRDGCALPTEMRSDTCNRYVCGALAELRRAGTPRAFVAAADRDGTVIDSAFVDGR